jgi:hypothetical protein
MVSCGLAKCTSSLAIGEEPAKRPYLLRFGAGSWMTLLSSSSERDSPWIFAPSPSCEQGHRLDSRMMGSCSGGGDSALLGASPGPQAKRHGSLAIHEHGIGAHRR